MDDMSVFEQRLAAGIQQIAGPRRPVDALAISRSVRVETPKWRIQPLFNATRFVVLGVIVALFAGFLVVAPLSPRSPEAGELPAAAVTSPAASPSLVASPSPAMSSSPDASATPVVVTTATITGSMLLPEGSDVGEATAWSISLRDGSIAAADAVSIGGDGGAISDPAATRIDFEIGYDPRVADGSTSYTLDARITGAAGELLFMNASLAAITDSSAPANENVQVPLVAVGPEWDQGRRVIELEMDAALRITQDGKQIKEIPVVPGETVLFRIDNTAGFKHNFYVGKARQLKKPGGKTDDGIRGWSSGVRELEWVVPDNAAKLRFGCTVPGHYAVQRGRFTVETE